MWQQVGDKCELELARGILVVELEPMSVADPDNLRSYSVSVRGFSKRIRYYNKFNSLDRAKAGALQDCIQLLERLRELALAHLDSVDADILLAALRSGETYER